MAISTAMGYGHDVDAPTGILGTGLTTNRNDIRSMLAAKLLDGKVPDAIVGQGATYATILGGVAKSLAAGKLLGDVQDDKDTARADELQRRQEQADEARQFMGQPDPAAAAPAAPAAPGFGAVPAAAPAAAPTGPGIKPPDDLLPHYQAAAKASGVPVEVLVAKDYQESKFDPSRKGAAGETGIPQILPSTAAQPGYGMAPISTADTLDPAKAIPWSAQYMANKAKALGFTDYTNADQLHGAVAAYNGAGPNAQKYANTVLGHVPQVARGLGGAIPDGGEAMAADKLGAGGSKADTPAAGTAMAARLSPDTVAAMQARADAAAASTNPLISRQAPMLAARAARAQASVDRQDTNDQRSAERQDTQNQRSQDRAERDRQRSEDRAHAAQLSRENRNPMTRDVQDEDGKVGTYVVNPDGSKGARIGDAANQHPDKNVQTVSTAQGVHVLNQDGTLGNRLGDLPREVQKPDKNLSDGVTKGIMGNMSTVRQLDQAIDAVGKNPDAFGMAQMVPGVSRFGPQASIDARGQVANIGSLKLHERSGAAVTASEFPRLAPFIPSATDPPATVKSKLQGMRRIVQEQLQDQYDTYGPGTGYKPVPGHGRALGIDDKGKAVGGTETDASLPGGTTAGSTDVATTPPAPDASMQRRQAAVALARQQLGPDASDADVLKRAQEHVGR